MSTNPYEPPKEVNEPRLGHVIDETSSWTFADKWFWGFMITQAAVLALVAFTWLSSWLHR